MRRGIAATIAGLALCAVLTVAFIVWNRLTPDGTEPAPVPALPDTPAVAPVSATEPDRPALVEDPPAAEAESHPAISLDALVLDAETLDPISGAAVRSLSDGRAWESGTPSEAVLTDGEGKARLAVSHGGARRFAVSAEAYRAVITTIHVGEPADGSTDVQLVEVMLPRGSQIAGRVLSDRGEPLAGARIMITSLVRHDTLADTRDFWFDEATADASGLFALTLPAAGNVVLEARRDGYRPALSDPLDVRARERLDGVEIVLARGEGRIEGVLLDPDGSPVSDGVVAIFDSESVSEIHRERVAEDGTFEFGGLALGTYMVAFESRGFIWGELRGIHLSAERPTETVTLRLEGAPRRLGGVVTDSDGTPIRGVRVHVRTSFGIESTAMTDASGRFELLASFGELRFTRAGFAGQRLFPRIGALGEPIVVSLERSARLDVRLAIGADDDISKAAYPPVGVIVEVGRDEYHVGTDTPSDDVPLDDDSEAAIERRRSRPRLIGLKQEFSVNDPRGRFTVEAPAGPTTNSVRVPGFVPVLRELETNAGETREIVILLDRGATITGRIVRAADGVGISSAEVILREDGPPRFMDAGFGADRNLDPAQTLSAADGAFEISGIPLQPGKSWTVWTRARGFEIARSEPLRFDGERAEVTLALEAEARVEGRVAEWDRASEITLRSRKARQLADPFDPPGKATTLGDVLDRVGWLTVETTLGDVPIRGDGTFTVEGLPAGTHRFELLDWSGAFTLEVGETKAIVVDFRSGAPSRSSSR